MKRGERVLSADRAQSLMDFNFAADIVLHEAGVPPIHTPATILAELPEEVRSLSPSKAHSPYVCFLLFSLKRTC